MNSFNFTNQRLKKIAPGEKDIDYQDTGQKGLFLRVTPSGNKIFRFIGWSKLRKKRTKIVIGRYPELSFNDAREIAAEHLIDLTRGVNVLERMRKEREEQSLDDIFEIWLEEHAKPNLKRWDQEKRRYELYIQPHLGKKKLSEITPDVITKWKIKLSKQKKERSKTAFLSKGVIHRAQIVLSSIFGKAAPQVPNPCKQVAKYKAIPRTVFMGTDDLKLFFEALDREETPEWLRDYLLISLYTGARQANILHMQWGQIDIGVKVWIIPGEHSKNSEPLIIPLLDQAVEILERRKSSASSVFVFHSPKSKTGHLVEPKWAWKKLLKRAGLSSSYRLHDLRRTMGSWQAITGTSTKIIGASLGHKSEQATAHYAHLTIEPIRAAMQRAADAMEGAKNSPEKIVKIPRLLQTDKI